MSRTLQSGAAPGASSGGRSLIRKESPAEGIDRILSGLVDAGAPAAGSEEGGGEEEDEEDEVAKLMKSFSTFLADTLLASAIALEGGMAHGHLCKWVVDPRLRLHADLPPEIHVDDADAIQQVCGHLPP